MKKLSIALIALTLTALAVTGCKKEEEVKSLALSDQFRKHGSWTHYQSPYHPAKVAETFEFVHVEDYYQVVPYGDDRTIAINGDFKYTEILRDSVTLDQRTEIQYGHYYIFPDGETVQMYTPDYKFFRKYVVRPAEDGVLLFYSGKVVEVFSTKNLYQRTANSTFND